MFVRSVLLFPGEAVTIETDKIFPILEVGIWSVPSNPWGCMESPAIW